MGQDTSLSIPADICERRLARWTVRRLGSLRHERRVLAAADELFCLLQPIHNLGLADRRLLRLAAIVHDVGRCVDAKNHPQVGAGMILADDVLPFSPRQRRSLAYLTRYHRGAVPKVGFEEMLRRDDDRASLRILLAILRAADAVDGRQLDAATVRFKLRERKLKVRVTLPEDSRRARKFFARRKKFRLLEDELDLCVDVALASTGAAA